MAARYFEFKDEISDKFWEIELKGSALHLRWGKTGTNGQSKIKVLESADKAQKEYNKLVAEKTQKGYQEGNATGKNDATTDVKIAEVKPKADREAYDFKLLEAVKAKDLGKVKEVLAGEYTINGTSENGSTILMWACKLGNPQIVQALIDAGADITPEMSTGSTALTIATKSNQFEVVKVLLSAGAKVDAKSYEVALDEGYLEISVAFNKMDPNKLKFAAEFQEAFGFLCETSEDKTIVEALSFHVKSMDKKPDGSLKVKIKDEVIECDPPFKGKPNSLLPKSYAAIAANFNGITWESCGGGGMGFGGLDAQGNPACDWGWDISYLKDEDEDEGEERDDLKDITPAFGCGQNWLLFYPTEKNNRGESALVFVGHDSCELVSVESANDLLYGSVLLKLMADYFLDIDFDEVYS